MVATRSSTARANGAVAKVKKECQCCKPETKGRKKTAKRMTKAAKKMVEEVREETVIVVPVAVEEQAKIEEGEVADIPEEPMEVETTVSSASPTKVRTTLVLRRKQLAVQEDTEEEDEVEEDEEEEDYEFVEVERVQTDSYPPIFTKHQYEMLEYLPRDRVPYAYWKILAEREMQPIHDDLFYRISNRSLKTLLTIDAPYETFRLFNIDDLVRNHWSNVRFRPLIREVCDRMASMRKPCCRNLRKELERMKRAK